MTECGQQVLQHRICCEGSCAQVTRAVRPVTDDHTQVGKFGREGRAQRLHVQHLSAQLRCSVTISYIAYDVVEYVLLQDFAIIRGHNGAAPNAVASVIGLSPDAYRAHSFVYTSCHFRRCLPNILQESKDTNPHNKVVAACVVLDQKTPMALIELKGDRDRFPESFTGGVSDGFCQAPLQRCRFSVRHV